jgi:septal ring factor EnvC (AmiA/AmiB activator)|tara:strand:+ start:98118 stop:99377 length:1260 start_codon:yes stop_codon:yes gene_type:complete
MNRLNSITRYFYIFIISFSLCLAYAQKSSAQDVDGTKRLDDIQREIDTVNQDKKKLAIQKKDLEKNIQKQEGGLLGLSAKIQGNELNQKHLKTQLLELTEKEKVLNASFKARKIDVERLIFAMIRLKTIPTEIMLLQPDGLLKAAQGSMVMGGVLPNVEEDLKELAQEIQGLMLLKEEIQQQKEQAEQVKRELAQDHKKLASLIEQRKTDLYNTNKNLHRHQLTLSKLSSEAKDVEDLLNKIAQLQNIPKPKSAPRTQSTAKVYKKQNEKQVPRSAQRKHSNRKAVQAPQGITPGMPVVGHVNVKYGQTDDIGARSQGWTITTHENAIVTAPFAGTVKYTGTFKRYGQIILIEHDENYFSLIGGISEIFVLPETRIRKGAPIAKMGEITKSSGEIGLYYEVRYKGKPVDPNRLLSSRKL